MTDFTPAIRRDVPLLLAFAGASGSGKTRSALRVASGLVGGDMRKVFVIDTEARRALHHADLFDPPFMHMDMGPPFRPDAFRKAIEAAMKHGAGAIIVDSFSDEYEGDGGLQDWADAEAERGVKSPGNWKAPKLGHKDFLNFVRQVRVPLLFCLRAEERIRIEPDPEKPNKTRVVPLGWMPVCEKRWMFDMAVSMTLAPDATRGMPRYDLPAKIPDWALSIFPEGRLIDESAGEALRRWASGGPSSGDRSQPAAEQPQTAGGAGTGGTVEPVPPAILALPEKARDACAGWWHRTARASRSEAAKLTDEKAWQALLARLDELGFSDAKAALTARMKEAMGL